MKEIIDQIIEIDTLAFENKTKNEQALLKKKQGYENIISSYRDEKIFAAKEKAQAITEEIDSYIIENEKSQKEKVQEIAARIDSIYSKAEKDLTEKIFNKLFVLEG